MELHSTFNVLQKRSELPRNKEAKEFKISVSYCQQLNISQCLVTEEKDRFVVNIYNPLGQYINKYVRVPVSQECNKTFYNFRVIDSNGRYMHYILHASITL